MFFYRKTKYIFIAHIPLFFYTTNLCLKSIFKKIFFVLFRWTHRTAFVAVSEFKRKKWCEPGTVIVLTPEAFPPLEANCGHNQIIVICNDLLNRKQELGFEMIEELAKEGFPIEIIGKNPGVNYAVKPKNFADFQEYVRRARIYLYTIRQPFGDGYNTAMLEVMNMGMAIVTVENPSSPIVHGVNGLIGKDVHELKSHLSYLLKNPEDADRLGQNARKTIAEKFSKKQFLDSWQKTLCDV